MPPQAVRRWETRALLKNKVARADRVFLLRWCVDARRYPPVIRRQLMWVGIIAGIGGLVLSAALLAFDAPSAVLEWVFGAAFAIVGCVGLPLLLLSSATIACRELGLERHRTMSHVGDAGIRFRVLVIQENALNAASRTVLL